jgi:hypothetical protein
MLVWGRVAGVEAAGYVGECAVADATRSRDSTNFRPTSRAPGWDKDAVPRVGVPCGNAARCCSAAGERPSSAIARAPRGAYAGRRFRRATLCTSKAATPNRWRATQYRYPARTPPRASSLEPQRHRARGLVSNARPWPLQGWMHGVATLLVETRGPCRQAAHLEPGQSAPEALTCLGCATVGAQDEGDVRAAAKTTALVVCSWAGCASCKHRERNAWEWEQLDRAAPPGTQFAITVVRSAQRGKRNDASTEQPVPVHGKIATTAVCRLTGPQTKTLTGFCLLRHFYSSPGYNQ